MTDHQKGKFITLEGGEGSGKTTLMKALQKHLNAKNQRVVITREPGGTPLAEEIRALILTGETGRMDALSEYLLFTAARHDHVQRFIKPMLEAGYWVLCDRFMDSSRVYQGYVGGVDKVFMEKIFDAAVDGCHPDITFLLDIDPLKGLERTRHRTLSENKEDRFERKGLGFHEKVRQGFLALARKNPRIHVLDACLSQEHLAQEAMNKMFFNGKDS